MQLCACPRRGLAVRPDARHSSLTRPARPVPVAVVSHGGITTDLLRGLGDNALPGHVLDASISAPHRHCLWQPEHRHDRLDFTPFVNAVPARWLLAALIADVLVAANLLAFDGAASLGDMAAEQCLAGRDRNATPVAAGSTAFPRRQPRAAVFGKRTAVPGYRGTSYIFRSVSHQSIRQAAGRRFASKLNWQSRTAAYSGSY